MKDDYYVRGWMFFGGLMIFEILGVLTGRLKKRNIDYVAHFTGAATGWLYAEVWKRNAAASRRQGEFVPKPSVPWWQQLGGNARNDGEMGK